MSDFFDRLNQAYNTPTILMSPADHAVIGLFAFGVAIIAGAVIVAIVYIHAWLKRK